MSLQIKKYFDYRNNTLRHDALRGTLGNREIQTLLTVLGLDARARPLVDKSIVDLGAGDRFLRAPIESRGGIYRGIDIDECNLAEQTFPLKDNCADIVISLSVIEHLSDPSHFLSETLRVLKPGGIVWLETPDIQATGNAFWNDPTHVRPYTRSSFAQLLQMYGFEGVSVFPNYRCKSSKEYGNSNWNFFRARYLMPLKGINRAPLPGFLKGGCTGLFGIGSKPAFMAQ